MVTSDGSAFQTSADITGNAQSSSVDRHVRGTATLVVEAERSLCHEAKSNTCKIRR